MAEKTFNTRIQLKYDTYSNWTTNNPKLKAGEMALATIETNTTGVQSAPTVLIKVGDGTHNYNDLPFASGKAADVYAWAKAANKPSYQASDITGLSNVASSGAAADVSIADSGSYFTATTVEGALQELGTAVATAGAVTMTTDSSPSDTSLLKTYTLSQNGSAIGTISIPKDLVAISGEIVNQDGSGTAGTFLKLTIQNGSPIYINVASLVEYNGVSDTDEIDMSDTNHVISATIKTGSIAKTKLASAVQASLDKADAAAPANSLANIATTGNVNDLIQTSGDVMVFNCGSSSTVI